MAKEQKMHTGQIFQEKPMSKTMCLLAGLLCATGLTAGEIEFRPLTQRCEEALALSALPAELRPRASVYVWREGRYVKTVSSDGGFHCLVQRNHPEAIIPECVTAAGEDSILVGIMAQTRLTADGLGSEEVDERFQEMTASGDIPPPKGPGVNYMMSAFNFIYSPGRDEVMHFGPHTMFFAPHASNDDIGGSFMAASQTKGFPFVAEAGSHSYIVTFTDKSAEPEDVLADCQGQLALASIASTTN